MTVPTRDVPEYRPPQQTAVVPVKSVIKSKILWTSVLSTAVLVYTAVGSLTPDQKHSIAIAAGIVGNIVIGVWRIWFNRTVTPE